MRRAFPELGFLVAWLDHLPLPALVVAAVLLGGAPWGQEPHLWQKLRLLATGGLSRPLDVFDLALHAVLPLLLLLKLLRQARRHR